MLWCGIAAIPFWTDPTFLSKIFFDNTLFVCTFTAATTNNVIMTTVALKQSTDSYWELIKDADSGVKIELIMRLTDALKPLASITKVDYLAYRKKHFENAAYIIQLGQHGKCNILVSALSFSTASFVLKAHHGISDKDISRRFSEFVKKCHITTVDSKTVKESLASDFKDFEDAMQYFSTSQISVYEPKEFLDILRKNIKKRP